MNVGGFRRSGPLWVLLFALLLVTSGCSPVPAPTASPTALPSSEANAHMTVELGGKITCAMFPYGCTTTLSLLPSGTPVVSTWRPPASDPWWHPDNSAGTTTDHFNPTPSVGLPTLEIGRQEVVISLLGSSDEPSYNPDGTRATELLGRCMADIDVGPSTTLVDVRVTFKPEGGSSFRAACTLAVSLTS